MPEPDVRSAGGLDPVRRDRPRATGRRSRPTMRAPAQRERRSPGCAGLGDPLDLREVVEVYLPLSRLLSLYAAGARAAAPRRPATFLGERRPHDAVRHRRRRLGRGRQVDDRAPAARAARATGRTPRTSSSSRPTASCCPNAELERRGLMDRKGFPESYDRRALLRFVSQVKSGAAEVRAPVLLAPQLRHRARTREIVVHRPDILIVEGLNVLQPPTAGHRLAVSDLFDFTVYVDARTSDIAELVRGALPPPAARRVRRPASRTSTASRRSTEEARERARRSGTRSTSRTSCRTSCRPARARRSCCARPPTTPCRTCCSARSDALRPRGSSTNTGIGRSVLSR